MFNSGFLLLADHYGFLPRACRPRRARTKGKVERMVKYLKENFFSSPAPLVPQLRHVNQRLTEQWMADVADRRENFSASSGRHRNSASRRNRCICRRCQVRTSIRSDSDIRHVSWDGDIEVGGNRYSVPESLCGQPVSIRIPRLG